MFDLKMLSSGKNRHEDGRHNYCYKHTRAETVTFNIRDLERP